MIHYHHGNFLCHQIILDDFWSVVHVLFIIHLKSEQFRVRKTQIGFQDVAFQQSCASLCTTFITVVVVIKALGIPHVLELRTRVRSACSL